VSGRTTIEGLKTVHKVTEALNDAIAEEVSFPDCRYCGKELGVIDADGKGLSEPEFYCETCEKIVERPGYYEGDRCE